MWAKLPPAWSSSRGGVLRRRSPRSHASVYGGGRSSCETRESWARCRGRGGRGRSAAVGSKLVGRSEEAGCDRGSGGARHLTAMWAATHRRATRDFTSLMESPLAAVGPPTGPCSLCPAPPSYPPPPTRDPSNTGRAARARAAQQRSVRTRGACRGGRADDEPCATLRDAPRSTLLVGGGRRSATVGVVGSMPRALSSNLARGLRRVRNETSNRRSAVGCTGAVEDGVARERRADAAPRTPQEAGRPAAPW
eukprot:353876-Chlamydomonas_euryale.AAC.5